MQVQTLQVIVRSVDCFISHVTDQLVAAASSAVGRTLKVHLASVVKSVMTDWQWASAEKGEGMPFV